MCNLICLEQMNMFEQAYVDHPETHWPSLTFLLLHPTQVLETIIAQKLLNVHMCMYAKKHTSSDSLSISDSFRSQWLWVVSVWWRPKERHLAGGRKGPGLLHVEEWGESHTLHITKCYTYLTASTQTDKQPLKRAESCTNHFTVSKCFFIEHVDMHTVNVNNHTR